MSSDSRRRFATTTAVVLPRSVQLMGRSAAGCRPGTVVVVLTVVDYQDRARATALYPDRDANPIYPAFGFVGEVGEIADKLSTGTPQTAEVLKEIGDVLWYAASLCSEHQLSLEQVATAAAGQPVSTFEDLRMSVIGNPETRTWIVLRMVAEAGKVAERTKKVLRDRDGVFDQASRQTVADAVGQVLVLASLLACTFDAHIADAAQGNLDKLASRAQRGVLGGSGDNR